MSRINVNGIDYNTLEDDEFQFVCKDGKFITNHKTTSILCPHDKNNTINSILPYVSPLFRTYGGQSLINEMFENEFNDSVIVLDFRKLPLPFTVSVNMFIAIDQLIHGKPFDQSILRSPDFIQFILFTEMYPHFTQLVKDQININIIKNVSNFHYMLWDTFENKKHIHHSVDEYEDEYCEDEYDMPSIKPTAYRKMIGTHVHGYKKYDQ